MANNQSKEIWLVGLLGALAGGAAVAFMTSKEGKRINKTIKKKYEEVHENVGDFLNSLESSIQGKKIKKTVLNKYQEIHDNIEDFLTSLESTIEENVDEKTTEWTEKAKETLEFIKDKTEALNPAEHKELGIAYLTLVLFGTLLGVGATLFVQDKLHPKQEDFLQHIASHVSHWKPLISEIRDALGGSSGIRTSGRIDISENNKVNDLLQIAVLGLKMWNNIKKRKS